MCVTMFKSGLSKFQVEYHGIHFDEKRMPMSMPLNFKSEKNLIEYVFNMLIALHRPHRPNNKNKVNNCNRNNQINGATLCIHSICKQVQKQQIECEMRNAA